MRPERQAQVRALAAELPSAVRDRGGHVQAGLREALQELDAWRDLARARGQLLNLYRQGGGPGGSERELHDRIERARTLLHELGVEAA